HRVVAERLRPHHLVDLGTDDVALPDSRWALKKEIRAKTHSSPPALWRPATALALPRRPSLADLSSRGAHIVWRAPRPRARAPTGDRAPPPATPCRQA